MTVIVWDGKTLAADKQATIGDLRRTTCKIIQWRGHLCAFAGHTAVGLLLFEWWKNGQKPGEFPRDLQMDDEKATSFWVITPKRETYSWEFTHVPIRVYDEKWAFGSGRDLAIGAMEMGADARRAVEVASKHNVACGGGIDTMTLEDAA
jgi:ATP-dependent protease HslVU (ClpYQ) peptidase subunit